SVKRVELLEQFYYTGIAGAASPVVQAKNYGGPLGQVRGNFFSTASSRPKWALREWTIINSGQPRFKSVTVKDNPLAEFYLDMNGACSNAPSSDLEECERVEFHKEFLYTSLTRLLEPDLDRNSLKPGQPGYKPELDPNPNNPAFDEAKYKSEILNGFAPRFQNRFNEFQSVSSPRTDDNPEAKAAPPPPPPPPPPPHL